jgi:hypothetical protein
LHERTYHKEAAEHSGQELFLGKVGLQIRISYNYHKN